MHELIKYFSALFFVLYMLIAFVVPSVRTYRQTGINPITFQNTDTAHDYIGKWFKIILALLPVTIVLYWCGQKYYAIGVPVTYLENNYVQWIGIILCLLSLTWTSIAQWQMGNSWRIGIDEKNKTTLITTGLFSVSRNPIFLGMQITLAGYFLLLPNAISFMVMIAGFLLMQIQARLEEEFLLKQHGDSYKTYVDKVNRFM